MLRIALSILLMIVSMVWIGKGILEYGLWVPGVSAHTGFIPTVFGGVVLLFSIVKLFKDIGELRASRQAVQAEVSAQVSKKQDFLDLLAKLRPFLPALVATLAIVLIKAFGMVIGTYASLFAYMKFISGYKWVKSLWVTAVITVFFYSVFVLWLKVPFPRGVFGI